MNLRVGATALAVVALGMATVPVAHGGPEPKKFTVRGQTALPSATFVTFLEWAFTCPSLPQTNGVSEYIFELPPEFARGDAVAELSGAGLPGIYGYDVSLYAVDCSSISFGNETPFVIPKGTAWIGVGNFYDSLGSFRFTATVGGPPLDEPSPVPSRGPTQAPQSPPPTGSPPEDDDRAKSEKAPKPKKIVRRQGRLIAGQELFVTYVEFSFRCPQMPLTQSVSGHVFRIPREFATGTSVALVAGGGTSVGFGSPFSVTFWDEDCTQIATTQAPSGIPESARYVLVQKLLEYDVDIELTMVLY